MDQDATWYAGRPRPRPHCVRWGPSSPPKGPQPLQFLAHVCCGQTAGWTKMPLGTEVGFSPGHSVRWQPSSHLRKGHSCFSHFSAHVCCGQTAGWIKMPLGMEVCLVPGHIVLDGDSALPKRAQRPFLADACCGQMAEWIKMPLGTQASLSPGEIVLDGDPAPG